MSVDTKIYYSTTTSVTQMPSNVLSGRVCPCTLLTTKFAMASRRRRTAAGDEQVER